MSTFLIIIITILIITKITTMIIKITIKIIKITMKMKMMIRSGEKEQRPFAAESLRRGLVRLPQVIVMSQIIFRWSQTW